MLTVGNTTQAFQRFTEVLELYSDIEDAMGQQAALGYMARTAHAAGDSDQALMLAEASLQLGRRINDRFGQSITLQLQLQIWQSSKATMPLIAVTALLPNLLTEIGDSRGSSQYGAMLEQIKPHLPEETFRELEENAEAVRAGAIGEAQARFEKTGRELFAPPASR